ncbi:ribosome biogenesis GTP-binding protein YsxC [Candidatus Nomurabacteria bacterium CG1_02_43_90]|uniref:Probable GTP-binding protein EngB n=1 Tax=Candidatus Nomurabacteria bacterium CG1_02_43_90 TaxID=1805281 RepID=A0A1J4UZE4_9BACT|nr:MAG: ribosome biogenesis GTP-binding protein YsxC [Candidatus Nomurabacteria bacterium CG1_02_43_90]
MEIKTAEFVKGIIGTDAILGQRYPQIAFVGRSNVGKSSAINSLVLRKGLVKSSSMPGKTREINFFLINKEYYFVDLPGYGFARMGAKGAEKIRKLILWYLGSGEARVKLVVLIVDLGVKPMVHDREMADILRAENINFVVVGNKADRLNQSERAQSIKALEAALGSPVIPFSARTKAGREILLGTILEACTK